MISPTIQNEIIEAIRLVIQNKIVERVKTSKFYSILCDETTDVSTVEQLTLCVRYVDVPNCVIREDFLGFIKMESTTGIAIATAIQNELENIGLTFENLRGQGYDGGSNMSGVNNGVQSLILKKQPLAFYTHCLSHCLNLCLSKACNVPAIKNMMGTIQSVSSFFSNSAKRTEKLKSVIESTEISESNESSLIKKKKLKTICETRWVERHTALMTFKELYVYIVTALEEIKCGDSSRETSSLATMLECAITKSEFLVALEVAVTCFYYTINLSQILQSKKQDLSKALADVTVVKGGLEAVREDVDSYFKDIFNEVTSIASKVNVEIKTPRVCGRQTTRVIIQSSPEEYYRISIFIPFLDSILLQLQTRFNQQLKEVIALEGLIPANFSAYNNDSILSAASLYENDLHKNALINLKAELTMWRNQWKDSTAEKPESALEALRYCTNVLPNIKLLLQLFATLPVTSATPERTFSTLKLLKNYLRSTMNEERLNGLAMAKINKSEKITEEEVIKVFSSKSHRRLLLLDWSK